MSIFSTDYFFFNDTATTEIYTLSLHDALPIWRGRRVPARSWDARGPTFANVGPRASHEDRKSTRLNSSPSLYRMASSACKNNIQLLIPTTATPVLLEEARRALDRIYCPGLAYY